LANREELSVSRSTTDENQRHAKHKHGAEKRQREPAEGDNFQKRHSEVQVEQVAEQIDDEGV